MTERERQHMHSWLSDGDCAEMARSALRAAAQAKGEEMMDKLNDLSRTALSAAMRGGMVEWGLWGSSEHIRYAQSVRPASRRRCHCGCKRRATHCGMANGICLTTGCELSIARWV